MNRISWLLHGIAVLAAVAAAPSAPAQEAGRLSPFSFSTGLEFTRGDLGGSLNTDIVYIPNTIRYETRPWTFAVTIPYILITGPSAVTSSGGKPVALGSDTGRLETHDGLGDIILSATYSQSRPRAGPLIEYTGKIKLPTADDTKGLGTGEIDLSGQIDASILLDGFMPFGTFGYQVLGDPEGAVLNDGFFFSVGVERRLSPIYDAGLVLDYREASVDTVDDAIELVPYLGWRATRRLTANFYVIMGLTDGSSEYGAGFQITIR